jgi:hypothetical protein
MHAKFLRERDPNLPGEGTMNEYMIDQFYLVFAQATSIWDVVPPFSQVVQSENFVLK